MFSWAHILLMGLKEFLSGTLARADEETRRRVSKKPKVVD
jgi:hypothetical protein